MFKFLRKHPPKDSEERGQLKKELFGYRRCLDHGFPSKPSCMAYDPKLKLLAIGTKTGRIKILGAPGVEWSVELRSDVSVNQLFFLPEQGRLLSLCSDNTVYLWEINQKGEKSVLEQKREYTFSVDESRMKGISVCCLTNNCEQLLIGTEIGNIYILDLNSFKLLDQIIYQDVVMQNVPDDFKVNPGAVEALAVHPTDPDKFLIGYNRGLIVLWDNEASNADQTYNSTQQLESLSWHRNGTEFMSAHNDGSYIIWSSTNSAEPKDPALTPYGPFPCKAISKIDWKTAKLDPFIIFAGGMPRASYGDRHTVTIMQGANNIHTVLDFTSKVVDFITISRADEAEDEMEMDEPHTLVVLAEEELVLIDLETQGWPAYALPYLNSLHCSPITCSQHVSNVPDNLWQKIADAGQAQNKNLSSREWPINGGKIAGAESLTKDLLLTGHEDGTVRFWDASSTSMSLLYKLSTASLFNVEIHGDHNSGEVEEEWPPFRKVGNYDPYSDDPRLGIQKIALCPLSETLVVAGTAGQVVVMRAERDDRELEVSSTTVSVVSDRDGFVWKGHEALGKREGEVTFPAGFQPVAVMQISPPAACTALAFHSEWQLVAAGTAHGFGLFDYAQKKEVTSRCTLNPDDLTGTSDTPISRRKSFKKSLRESFRRLRRRRSERRKAEEKTKEQKKGDDKSEGIEEKASPIKTSPPASPESRPVERQVEARNPEDSISSMVRCLYFATTYISDVSNTTSSLWVGTNGGHVYIYTVTVPQEKRSENEVAAVLAKEIKLRHKAPVMSIAVVDGRTKILPDPLEVQHARAKEPQGNNHSVVICSEEQLKIFTLPHLKAKWKYKITAVNGSRIRKVAFINFRSRSDDNYSECNIACLNNQGELSVYSVSTLRQQLEASCLRREDINGISSFTFSKNGQGFYLQSASEYARVTLSARCATEPTCSLELKEGMRVVVEDEPEPETQEAAQTEGNTETEAAQTSGGDNAEGLNDSVLNDSQANTTMEGEITQDSVQIMQHTEEVSTSTETTRTASVQETTTTVISGDNLENSTVTTTVTESSQQVTSSGDAPITGNNEENKVPTPETQIIEKTEEQLTKLKISDEDEALNKKRGLETTAEIQATVTAS